MQLDLSANFLREFPTDALRHLTELKFLNISNNLITVSIDGTPVIVACLSRLSSRENYVHAIISTAYIGPFSFSSQEIEQIHLSSLTELQVLDLSRNNIGRLGVNTFSKLSVLTRLDLSLNALRTVRNAAKFVMGNG